VLSIVLGSIQTIHAGDSRTIKDTIERMETVELSSRSEMVREVYKRSLLRLYGEYLESLEKEIADLKYILANVSTSDSRIVGEITDNIKKLQSEYSITNEKFRTLSADLRVNKSSSPAQGESRASSSGNRIENSHNGYREAGENSNGEASENADGIRPSGPKDRNVPEGLQRASLASSAISAGSHSSAQTDFEITWPKDDSTTNIGKVEPEVTLDTAAGLTVQLKVTVKSADKEVDSKTLTIKAGEDSGIAPPLKLKEGTNKIIVSDENAGITKSIDITYEPEKNGDTPVSTIATSSLNTRAVIGFEQAGASSASSETKPFLDFFFTGPLKFGKDKELPRLSTWGQIRLSTTPEQTGAAGAFPSNLVNQVAQTSKTVDLVQSFDFLAGLEGRIFDSDKHFSLIPGIKQKISFYLVGGGGAISPLSTKRESAQIFSVPSEKSPQRQLFIDRFGNDAADKKYIAFVLPERDRFLRQFYGGVRFKTHFYKDGELINRFPAILDVMVGQNEAVTGGKLKSDETDASGKIIGKRRSYVLRLDGFYPLPIKEASFLYLYGTAMMKLGGGGVRITTPLFLDTAPGEILVTNNDVFIAPNLQLDRDYYKIGIGINLTDLFNRKPSEAKK